VKQVILSTHIYTLVPFILFQYVATIYFEIKKNLDFLNEKFNFVCYFFKVILKTNMLFV
jgi:hypothetical protein